MSVISQNRSGFTLLELLVAMALLAVLTAALYGSYFTVLGARDRSAASAEARRELAATLDLIRREVAAAVYAPGRHAFVVEDRDHYGKPASTLELATLAPPDAGGLAGSGIVVVGYRFDDGVLRRSERDALLSPAAGRGYPQVEQIEGFLVECHDGEKWVRSWDTGINKSLPRRLRVTVSQPGGRTFAVLAAPMAGAP